MRSFYMRIFKNIICIYVLALCCFAYATMIHAIPDHVYVQEGQKLELDKKIPVTLAMSTKPQSVMAQIGERTFQAMKQERAVETCSQLKQGEYTLTCYLFGILPMKEVQVSVVNGKSLYVSGQVVGIYGAAQGVLVLGSGPVETVDGSSRQPAEHIVFPGDYITAVNGKAVTKKEELMERINQYGEQPVVLTLWRGAEQIQVSVEPVEAAEHKGYRLGLWVKDDMAGIGTLTYFDQDGNFGALGHGIGNGQTKDLLRLSDGRLYKAQVLGIKKGVRGTPGELEGVVYYGKDNQIGEVSSNTQIGIYGTLTKNFREEKKNETFRFGHQCFQFRFFHALRQEDHQFRCHGLCTGSCQIVGTFLEKTTHRHHGWIFSFRFRQIVLTAKLHYALLNTGHQLPLRKRLKNSAVCPQTCAICYFRPFILQLSENGTFQDVHRYLTAVHCLTFSRLRFLSAQQPLLLLHLTLLPHFSHGQYSLY